MATIRASCDQCGDVDLTTSDVEVRICVDDDQASYAFRCPDCESVVVKPTERGTVDLLVAAGVSCATWSLPAEMSEPRDFGDAITHDDLLEFHEFLSDDVRLAEALLDLAS